MATGTHMPAVEHFQHFLDVDAVPSDVFVETEIDTASVSANIGPASRIWYGTPPSEKSMTENAPCPASPWKAFSTRLSGIREQ